jgi:hypothetical protein
LLPFLFSFRLVLPIFSPCSYYLLFFFFHFLFPHLVLIAISCPSPPCFFGRPKKFGCHRTMVLIGNRQDLFTIWHTPTIGWWPKNFNHHLTHHINYRMTTKILWSPKRENKGWKKNSQHDSTCPTPLGCHLKVGYDGWWLKFFNCQKRGRIIPHHALLGNRKISIIIQWWGCVERWLNCFNH